MRGEEVRRLSFGPVMGFGGFLVLMFAFLILAIAYIAWENRHWWKQWEKRKKEEHDRQESEKDYGPK